MLRLTKNSNCDIVLGQSSFPQPILKLYEVGMVQIEWFQPDPRIGQPVNSQDEPKKDDIVYCDECGQDVEEHGTCYNCGACADTMCYCNYCDECDNWDDECVCDNCMECGNHIDDCGCNDYETACDVWELPSQLSLKPLACDFYLLYDLYLDDKDDGRLDDFVQRWLPVFKNYTDMVIGGELRHNNRRGGFYNPNLKEMHDFLRTDGSDVYPRSTVWVAWNDFRARHGIPALRWAQEVFHAFGGGGYGGPLWANIAETLEYLEEGEISDVMFMDMVWGLQHNGGQYFSKLMWDMSGVTTILDSNLHGNMQLLLEDASYEVRKFYNEVR